MMHPLSFLLSPPLFYLPFFFIWSFASLSCLSLCFPNNIHFPAPTQFPYYQDCLHSVLFCVTVKMCYLCFFYLFSPPISTSIVCLLKQMTLISFDAVAAAVKVPCGCSREGGLLFNPADSSTS